MINGLIYHERLISSTQSGDDWMHTNMYYRSDDSGRVYAIQFSIEHLLYDYSLKLNDSFAIGLFGQYLIVANIDTIILKNGEQRKRLWMRCSFDTDPPNGFGYIYWIDGLGGEKGVYDIYAEECGIDADVVYTLCISRNDTLLYFNPNYDSCWYLPVATKTIKSDPIMLFPNPTKDKIQITGIEDPDQFIIYNSTGKIMDTQYNSLIDLTGMVPGIYFIDIVTKRSRRHIIKAVIKI